MTPRKKRSGGAAKPPVTPEDVRGAVLLTPKDEAERRLAAGEPLGLEDLILTIPGYDPRTQAGDCWFSAKYARLAIGFFHELLHFVEGEWAGRPFKLEPWQQAIIANLFGWRRPDGFRRYREMFLMVPRKNGKTPLAAGIVLLLLCGDNEPGAQIYSAAAELQQAALIYRHASQMVMASPVLRARLQLHKTGKAIERPKTSGFYRALSADAKSKHGFSSHGVVVDELHALLNGLLVDALTSSTGARRQPLIVYITTTDFAREGSICNEKEFYAEQVAKDIVKDPEFLPVIYRAEATDPWDDERTWKKANPNYGVSVKPEEMHREAAKARLSPRVRSNFMRLRLNVKTSSDVVWVPMDRWDPCGLPAREAFLEDEWIEEMGIEGGVCYGGLDLSAVKDLTSFVLYFPEQHVVLPYFWAPGETAEAREMTEGVSYTAWAQEGWIDLSPGATIRHDAVRKKIQELGERFRIREIAFDRWGAANIVQQLDDDGFNLLKFGQGYASMSEPSKALERLWLDRKLRHGGHPVLRWCASNATVVSDEAENIKPSKKKSRERIDGIVALVMAVGASMTEESDPWADTKGFKTV